MNAKNKAHRTAATLVQNAPSLSAGARTVPAQHTRSTMQALGVAPTAAKRRTLAAADTVRGSESITYRTRVYLRVSFGVVEGYEGSRQSPNLGKHRVSAQRTLKTLLCASECVSPSRSVKKSYRQKRIALCPVGCCPQPRRLFPLGEP